MFQALFNVLFSVIVQIVNLIMSPVNALVSGIFPDFNNMIATFNVVLNTYVGGAFSWFFSILPPMCRNFIIIYLTFLVSYYTISISAHAIIKVYTIIKRVKIW